MVEIIKEKESEEKTLALLELRVTILEETVKDLIKCLPEKFITISRFVPIERLFYGLGGTILLLVLTALVWQVLKK